MPAKQGTLNVVDKAVYAVFSIPAAALHGADDDGDGQVSSAELARHIDALRAEIDRGVTLFDGERRATTVRIDLLLSPQHEAAQDRAEEVIVLEHAVFADAPREVGLAFGLFGPANEITVTATERHPQGDRVEAAVFTPEQRVHRYFASGGPNEDAPAPARTSVPWVLAAMGALGVLLGAATWARRRAAPA